MFSLAQKCGLDICYRCKRKIETVDEFTIDHKTPWLHSENPHDLFFDLENIAFSHATCNGKERRLYRKIGSSKFKGVSYAKDCNREKPYRAYAFVKGKKLSFGYYSTPEEAARTYDTEIVRLCGDKAVTNKSLGLL